MNEIEKEVVKELSFFKVKSYEKDAKCYDVWAVDFFHAAEICTFIEWKYHEKDLNATSEADYLSNSISSLYNLFPNDSDDESLFYEFLFKIRDKDHNTVIFKSDVIRTASSFKIIVKDIYWQHRRKRK